jgi:hypothetical protein
MMKRWIKEMEAEAAAATSSRSSTPSRVVRKGNATVGVRGVEKKSTPSSRTPGRYLSLPSTGSLDPSNNFLGPIGEFIDS